MKSFWKFGDAPGKRSPKEGEKMPNRTVYTPKRSAMSPTATPSSQAYPPTNTPGMWQQNSGPQSMYGRPNTLRYNQPNPAAYGSYSTQQQSTTYTPRSMPSASPNTTSSLSSTQSGRELLSCSNLYLRHLSPNTTDEDLVELCQRYGKIVSTKAIMDQTTNKCKGYGFVDFENPQDAAVALKNLQAQNMQVQMAKQQEQDPTNLYISNLPLCYTETNLENMFKDFGTVISTRILRKTGDNTSRGVGFTRMENKEKCQQIIDHFNGKVLPGCTLPLLVKFADGGNKKKNTQIQQKIWPEREGLFPLTSYDQAAFAQNGVAQALMAAPQGILPRYAMSTPQTTYQVQSSPAWGMPPGGYIMQPHMPAFVAGHPAASAAAFNQMYAQAPGAATMLQALPIEDHDALDNTPHFQTYAATPSSFT
ncbi:RNA-binding motif, single-stranded-interacting protein 2-like isoform X2 [Pecten maximus]|uniref:RNA-binding motif, single-stranded-interacting protein 2-like isoform X2 n=1 Tax=Pecten maximus TaxID=6579 RepID=UPI0014581CE0|nr:RNA-binding motif, single-stranded-interacting protein 2-like isoform X2 [Pecten maximus]